MEDFEDLRRRRYQITAQIKSAMTRSGRRTERVMTRALWELFDEVLTGATVWPVVDTV
jgi:hypothetical protein